MAIRFDHPARTLWLSIGDLLAGMIFPGSVQLTPRLRSRAALGRDLHIQYQAERQSRIPSYQAEVTLRQRLQVDDYTVHVHGRLDGLYEADDTLVVEEIKSLLVPREQFDAIEPGKYPVYERQLALYIALLHWQHDRPVRGHLVLINLTDDACTVLTVEAGDDDWETLIVEPVRRILARYEARVARAARRQPEAVVFPFDTTRPHQEALIEHVDKTIRDRECTLISAPTGIGKTVAALFPALRHALRDGLRVFFVTAKTTQQTLASETLRRFAGHGTGFTAVHLRAKAKSCLNEVFFCHESVCEFAHDYAGKLERSGVLDTLLELPVLGPTVCAETALLHRVCPFELSLDAAVEADVIIGDYNYVFDPGAYLRRFFQDELYDDCILIIDEAHNLYGRGRDYYSPVLRQQFLRQLLVHCAAQPARLFRDFEAFFQDLDNEIMLLPHDSEDTADGAVLLRVEPPVERFAGLRQRLEGLMVDYAIFRRRAGPTAADGDPVQDFYYLFQRFCDVLALGGDEFSYLYQHQPDGAAFKILCKDASRFLYERLQGFHSVIGMSATLTPFPFYQDVLGMPPDRSTTAEFPSPFPDHNRRVLVVPDVATTYRERRRDAPLAAQVIEAVVAQRPGNYGVFFPSFAYLRLVRACMRQVPAHQVIEQAPTMTEAERELVLQRLRQHDDETLLLLGVQGGIFAEGVDYPGDMLKGVIVVGPGLPRVDGEQELIRAYFEEKYTQGFAYAYLYPGMNRVVQSAGRVIRSETDVGIIVLVDKRFSHRNYASLFPSYWYGKTPRELVTSNYQQNLADFWRMHDES